MRFASQMLHRQSKRRSRRRGTLIARLSVGIWFLDTHPPDRENYRMRIIHGNTGIVLGRNVSEATSFWKRLRGYMFYPTPPPAFDGLYFPGCKVVHNSFVRFALDVIFVDKNSSVVKILRGFQPWKFSSIYFNAAHAIEFPAGTVPDSVSPGDKLVLEF